MRKNMRGVTMMELLIVVVIISILAAIAYPNYRQYAARAKRNEARSALLQVAALQERFYLQNNGYTADMKNLGFPVSGGYITDSETYKVNVATGANGYTATATYIPSDDEASKCKTFTITADLIKTSGPATDCWARTR